MTDWTSTQKLSNAIASIPSSVISLIVTSWIVIAMIRSETKLKKPSRRLILGMSLHGFIQAVVHCILSILNSSGQQMWAMDHLDNKIRFLSQLTALGIPSYSLSLAILYICIIKYEMPDERFAKKVEPFLHFFSNLLALMTPCLSLIFVNTSDTWNCWAFPYYPNECQESDGAECIVER